MQQLKIQSSKIKCAGCASNIEKGLDGFSGVSNVSVDIESNIVNVEGNDLDKALIENKLAELGYPSV